MAQQPSLIKCATERGYKTPFGREFLGPEPGVVYAPWVRMRFKIGDKVITVGNESLYQLQDNGVRSRQDNTAIIKQFQYGTTDGFQCHITVHDESGSNFATFMRHIITDLKPKKNQIKNEILVSFGWCRIDCDGKVLKEQESCEFKMNGMEIEILFNEGLFVYNFTGSDTGRHMIESTKVDIAIGQDGKDAGGRDKGVHLTNAVKTLLTDDQYKGNTPPYVDNVRFLEDNGVNETATPVKFRTGTGQSDERGISGVWRGLQRDKLNAAKSWLDQYPVEDGADPNGNKIYKTLKPVFNSCCFGPNCVNNTEILYIKDRQPGPSQQEVSDKYTLGYYYVNGGKDSRVIEFNPKMKTNFMALSLAGGNMPNGKAMGKNGSKVANHPNSATTSRNNPDNAYKSAGTETSVTPNTNLEDANKKNAMTIAGEGQAVANMATTLTFASSQASLTIVGDPSYLGPFVIGRKITIIFINPFYLCLGSQSGDCQDWTVTPDPCNDILTNKNWFINSYTHQIQEGSFTTTLDLTLQMPGISLDVNTFGADPKGFQNTQ